MPGINNKVEQSIQKIYKWMASNQTKEGTWPVPYDGPFFLLPLYIFALRICNRPFSAGTKTKMSRYILRHQLPDGSFGLHQEAKSGTVFTSVINYVALRFLGLDAEKPELRKCLGWIHEHGGPLYAGNWAKFILAFLNLYSYTGITPVPPELYLLPAWFPFHPRKISGYVRIIYLPMCYFYREKFAIEPDDLILSLRKELYQQPYDKIKFAKYRGTVAETDNIFPETRIFKTSMWLIKKFDPLIPKFIKKKALDLVYEHIEYEDKNSSYIRQAPVNAVYNTLIYHFRGEQEKVEKSWEKLPLYLWETKDEILMQGFTNTYTWDCGFYLQAIGNDCTRPDLKPMAEKTRKFLRDNQVMEELENPFKYHRIERAGGWTFSFLENGWVVSDCTAEAVKALLETEETGDELISDERINKAIDLIMLLQSDDGGWSSVDKAIGNPRLEWFNAANVFVDIMVDHSYVECTASIIQAFMQIKQSRPHLITDKIEIATKKGYDYLIKSQYQDGSWEAVWGLCFTYGICFVVEGLCSYGMASDDAVIQRACDFLWSKQREDGGWGEAQETALAREYIQAEVSIVDHTAWSILALINGGFADDARLKKAINWMIEQQEENGDWPVQPITGLFYKTTMVSYKNYRRYFPLMALKKYRRKIEVGRQPLLQASSLED
jgi:squalene/oxidosqualene cyclase-like protein